MKLDIVVPCHNEEENVSLLYDKIKEELKNINYTVYFINDGSIDKTLESLKKLYEKDKERIKIISFTKNFGKDAAIYAGLLHSKSDYACIIDADLQQDPKYLVKMYDFLESNLEYDVIAMCQKQTKNRFFQRSFYKIMNIFSEYKMEDGASDFRMFRSCVVKSLIAFKEKNRFTKGMFSYIGYNTYYDRYDVKTRATGKSNFNLFKLFKYAFNGIVAFSTKPLKFATLIGLITSLSAFVYLIIIIVQSITNGIKTPGYPSLMCVLLFLGGIQLICLGVVGEYIGKIYNESKDRPIYISKEELGFEENIL